MDRETARKIANTITNSQLKQMFDAAREGIKDWNEVSNVNIGITKGTAWNILAKNFDVNKEYYILAITNMVWEFGDFLPKGLLPEKPKEEKPKMKPYHEDPEFPL